MGLSEKVNPGVQGGREHLEFRLMENKELKDVHGL